MLTYRLLNNHAGLLLVGDYLTLKDLYKVVHDINDRSPLVRDKEGSFLGLAYDVRKAYEGQRQILNSPSDRPEIGPRFGVEILWPVILWQCRMLRASMAFINTSKNTQALAYALEAVIEDAIRDEFGGDAVSIIAEWERLDPSDGDSEVKLISRGGAFCSWTKVQRRNALVSLLASFNPMYTALYPVWVSQGVADLVAPHDYEKWAEAEWPDPKW